MSWQGLEPNRFASESSQPATWVLALAHAGCSRVLYYLASIQITLLACKRSSSFLNERKLRKAREKSKDGGGVELVVNNTTLPAAVEK